VKKTKYLLIGAGLAASQAAKQLRRKDADSPIVLVGDEPYIPYDRPPLSKEFLRGEKSMDDLFFDREPFFSEQRIEVLVGHPVEHLDAEKKIAHLVGSELIVFEKALIATGGRPIRLNFPGANLTGVHYLRTLDDSAAIAADVAQGKRAVIIGAGFIGMEVAASLAQQGAQVTVIEAQDHIWARFADKTLASFFQDYCRERGIIFYTRETVREIRGTDRVSAVVTASGKELSCDFVCIGVGIKPNVELAQGAGLTVDNGIVVDECLRTSSPDLYAAGDVANYPDPIFGKRRRVEHWGHAEYCGQIAALNMLGQTMRYGLLTYVWSDIFDLHLEFAGDESEHDEVILRGSLNEKSFTVLFLKQDRLTAYFAVNTDDRAFPTFQRLIRRKEALGGKRNPLQDPEFDLKQLNSVNIPPPVASGYD
jgi:NAD(P)H-nitrite reductase